MTRHRDGRGQRTSKPQTQPGNRSALIPKIRPIYQAASDVGLVGGAMLILGYGSTCGTILGITSPSPGIRSRPAYYYRRHR